MEVKEASPATLRIEPHGWLLPVPAGSTLLMAAEAAGVELASSCRNGTCRSCICLKTAGEVSYRIAWPGLSREEKQEGYVLPCVAYAEGDVALLAPGALRV
ncbi:2Fe-2S iron-sulfur cluster binding domain-containing protein [Xylophilus rhododendri]|uniref:2Fe-2S iron-sulfur cluster binding domain-containing protein n=1 Tax=Xylophilus rhododendri TaxID=2697032 RepID=A0A857J9E0_9BURK|nr:2Fe-2S iron-sulfur cluster-binding protein [Xylophilus rhododendri]QHI99843.1 2Fe-2S iron-sulfur cluster binding domain-containing protein [Xylophilus rhododendri]